MMSEQDPGVVERLGVVSNPLLDNFELVLQNLAVQTGVHREQAGSNTVLASIEQNSSDLVHGS